MDLNYAAHVDHPISHSSNIGQLALGIGAAVIATVVVVYSGGTALLAFGPAMAAAGTVATAGNVGMLGGKVVDAAIGESNECFIATGFPTVLLGEDIKPAARADAPDTKTRGWHEIKVAEGSKTVMLGPEFKPMSRRGDRIDSGCGGKIVDGLHSLLVGGEPSKQGTAISEEDSTALKVLTAIFDIVGGASTAVKGGAVNAARGALQLGAVPVGGDAGKVMKAVGQGRGDTVLEKIDAWNTWIDGGRAANNIATGIISPGQ